MFNNKNNNPTTAIDDNPAVAIDSKTESSPPPRAPDPATLAPAINISDNQPPSGPIGNNPVPIKTTLSRGSKTADASQLTKLREQALSQLRPIVDELDQPPKEQFRTLMMLIQAGEAGELMEKALSAAGSIEDSRGRAQALLDIVNEINYLKQKK